MKDRFSKSKKQWKLAQAVLAGGVDSPVRSFKAVGGTPIFMESGQGAVVRDIDGNEYIDYVGSWGPLILGHAYPQVLKAVVESSAKGTSFGAPTVMETELAILVNKAVPSMQKVRFVSSGTEALMSAVRLARGFTSRKKIIKFDGCYHGHSDSLLVQAGSGVATLGIPGSAGVPAEIVANTLSLPYQDLDAVQAAFKKFPKDIAAVVVEPIAGNMGVVAPRKNFLQGLARLSKKYGALLIFDEVITGFRVAWGGAQSLYQVEPDLTCLGKVIGGGMPVGAYGGRSEIMDKLAPLGPVYQAGTLSGNPVAMAAGLATLKALSKKSSYKKLEQKAVFFEKGLCQALGQTSLPWRFNRVGSMFTLFFSPVDVIDYATARKNNSLLYRAFFHELLQRGVYFPPSSLESCFISLAHTEEQIKLTVDAVSGSLQQIQSKKKGRR